MKSVKKNKFFYITTPIFYPNGRLHMGHAYTSVIADIIANYKKSKGYEVYFHTGSDDHGEKIEKTAASLAISPQKLVDQNVLFFQELWQRLGINYDIFYRTSCALHKTKVQKFFTKLLEEGDIYLGKYQGNYCVTCEDYVKDSLNNKDQTCPACFSSTRVLEEKAYFFKVSKYRQRLLNHYESNPDFLIPANAKKELFANFLNDDIRDLCITRSNINWGIPVPNNPKMIIYVWFDALCNYLTSEIGEQMFNDGNSEIVHLVGKEIARFHALYWPTFLFALKKRLPNKIIAHSWIITPEGKMSKSKGNVADPLSLLQIYPADLLRTYFVAKINLFKDGVFTEELLKNLYQNFYVNGLGNLYSRVNKMIEKHQNLIIPVFRKSVNLELKSYYRFCLTAVEDFQKKMDSYQLIEAWKIIEKLVEFSNKLITKLEPWNLFKNGQIELLEQTLNYLANGIKIVAFLLKFVAPNISKTIFNQLNIEYENHDWNNIKDFSYIEKQKIKELKNPLFVSSL